ncbi:MAG: hypothetical protein DHS20C15_05470 [Planctomycetota bacterium]|nr:MAG: hypothetical protein DHS20C15_05470 [Planctomycetota bacterium]
MKTLLSVFCNEFDGVVRPVLAPLTKAADTLNQVSDKAALRSLLPTVLDVRHHLSSLADKVAEQQAYVLIFGPLKSGKSTLMNALSGAYVSEVTTLPAYPCMVYVSHADQVSFEVTRYTGESEEFRDMDSMRTLMEWAHNELAERIREVEGRAKQPPALSSGDADLRDAALSEEASDAPVSESTEVEEFDPATHIPQAIRRIDVRLPANHLERSSAVLVDTPGLYSRMKFGYDRMTREFRNTASCAIFVVKTDNLFLEQVFDEFGQLLDLFSRIFLVVNIDSTKRDLFPDGELGPSLETSDPDRIITAFENLSMTAPLKQAVDEGRLRIYPVDLLQAASQRLRGEDNDDAASSEEPVGLANFHAFQSDLTDYLNSTDYMSAFLGDSLRQARGLLGEVDQACQRDEVSNLASQVASLGTEAEQLAATEHAITRLEACGWDDCFSALGDDLTAIAGGRVDKLRDSCSIALADAVDEWFHQDSSFQDLIDDALRPLLSRAREDLAETARGVLSTVAGSESAGASLPDELVRDIQNVGLDLGALGRRSLGSIEPAQGLAGARLRISTEQVPVRKGLFDYLFFRGRGAVRQRLLGPAAAPSKLITSQAKQRRLGDPGRDALQDAIEDAFDNFFDEALDHLSTKVLEMYVVAVRKSVKTSLRKSRDSNGLRKATVDRKLEELRRVESALREVSSAVDTANASLLELSTRYGSTDPSLLEQEVSEEFEAELAQANDGSVDAEAEGGEASAVEPTEPSLSAETDSARSES